VIWKRAAQFMADDADIYSDADGVVLGFDGSGRVGSMAVARYSDGYLEMLERDRRLMRHVDDSVVQLARIAGCGPSPCHLRAAVRRGSRDLSVNYRRREVLGSGRGSATRGTATARTRTGADGSTGWAVGAPGPRCLGRRSGSTQGARRRLREWQGVIASGWPESVLPFDILSWLPATTPDGR